MRATRLTTRRLMVVVAVVAVLLAGPARLWARSIRFEKLAVAHRGELLRLPFEELELYLFFTPVQGNAEATPAEKKRFSEEVA